MTDTHSKPTGPTGSAEPAAPEQLDEPTQSKHRHWWWLITAAAVVVTFIVARAIPPWHPDGTWWGKFFTSAGFGGTLAVVGASIAAYIAYHNSQEDRVQSRELSRQDRDHSRELARQERAQSLEAIERARWWDRLSWACEKAVSKKPGESEMALTVIRSLLDAQWVKDEDWQTTLGVMNVIIGMPEPAKDGWRE